MRSIRFALIALAVLLLAAGWAAGYVSLNRFYDSFDNSVVTEYGIGEDVPFGEDYINAGLLTDGYVLRVDGLRIADFKDVCPDAEGHAPEKLALVDVTLRNTGSTAQGVMLPELALYGIDELLFMNYEALDRLNPVLEGNPGIRLRDGTEYRLTLPYSLNRADFSRRTWETLDSYGLYLQVTCPPGRKIVRLR